MEPTADMNGVGVVRHEEWRRRGSGGLQHTRIEATHWSAPAHTYGKVRWFLYVFVCEVGVSGVRFRLGFEFEMVR